MTGSVERVAKERPNLRKLTFVISSNLATSRQQRRGRPIRSQRQKYDEKIATWKRTVPGADKVEFDLVQESGLLDELAKPEHNGRRWFWWNDIVLGPAWLTGHYKQQVFAASEKYRPDLQVDVPIQEDLLAIGFDEGVLATFNRLLGDVVSAVAEVHIWPSGEDKTGAVLCQAIQDTAAGLSTVATALTLQAANKPAALDPLLASIDACQNALYARERHERARWAAWEGLPADDPQKANKPPEKMNSYGLRGLTNSMGALASWLESSVGRSFLRQSYFLTGQAGAGKTHLLLDAT
jgi:hypothetical protein